MLAPVGISKIHEAIIPRMKHKTDTTPAEIITLLNVLKSLIEVTAGNTIRLDIKSVPIILIPITIVTAVKKAISKLNASLLKPVAFANSSSNVTAKSLL